MKIKILGAHNCESRNSKLISLLIDDVLAIDAGALTSSLSFSAQQKLKAILLTHQHYDHIRDIPAIAMNAYLRGTTVNIYSIPAVYDVLATHLLNDKVYPNFFKKPERKPTIRFTVMEPNQRRQIGDYHILVAPMTTPDFVPLMKRAGAIITDEGGLLCHASIVARELKKPCIVGTKIATQVLKDEDLVEVDATKGIVKILKRA